MRAYFFGNYYLSSIQQGIQSAHCLHEMFNKYASSERSKDFLPYRSKLFDWSMNHKTMIVLNGGNSSQLDDLYSELIPISTEYKYPLAKFNEDYVSLNEALTCVGIILPETVYNPENQFGISEFNLHPAKLIIDRYGLAK